MNKKLQNRLVKKALEASRNSYAPYSGLRVGAALLVAGQKRIISGGNVENASYGLTICAERTALGAAVTAGHRKFEAIAVVASGTQASPEVLLGREGSAVARRLRRGEKASPGREKPIVPCGACLQALAEFCPPDLVVLAAAAERPGKPEIYKLRDLLPRAFRFRP